MSSPVFWHGRKSGIGTSAVQMTATSRVVRREVTVTAGSTNTGIVYVGNSSSVTADAADATDGMELVAGESVDVQTDDPAKIYLIGSAASQKVFWLAQ